MNSIRACQAVVDRAMTRDKASAEAEYGARFRSDIESFVSLDVVAACTGDHVEMLPLSAPNYFGFVDPSGGSADSFTLAVAHADDTVVVDCLREVVPPFSPDLVVEEFAALLNSYRIASVSGDRYGGEFPRELFAKAGVTYKVAEKPKSDLYRDLLPLLNAGRIVLPRNDRLTAQLVGLERRTSRAGKDSIDHGPGQHDDLANACAGVASAVMAAKTGFLDYSKWAGFDEPAEPLPALPKRRHPNLSDEQFARIR